MGSELPHILETDHVMSVTGWPRWRVIHWMRSTGAGEKHRRRWFTTLERLLVHFPPAAHAAMAAAAEKAKKTSAQSAMTVESRMALMASKIESNTRRTRSLEREVRKNRSEIRKLRKRLNMSSLRGQRRATPSNTD